MASTSHVSFVLDTQGPSEIVANLNGGSGATDDPCVMLMVHTRDRMNGAMDVAAMRIYGDVDAASDPLVQPLAANSEWIPYRSQYPVILSVGAGTKTIRVQLRDWARNVSAEATATIAYTLRYPQPVVTVLSGPHLVAPDGRISNYHGTLKFDFRLDQNCDTVSLNLVSTYTEPYSDATSIYSFFAPAVYLAGRMLSSTGNAFSDVCRTPLSLVTARSPADGPKILKIFARMDDTFVWSL